MKLRVQGNTIRVRVNQTELKMFEEKGLLETSTQFDSGSLIYALVLNKEATEVISKFDGKKVEVVVPEPIAKKWFEPTEVGFENNNQKAMKILVEKDFQCLHKRSGEDESDSFPNPLADKLRD